MLTPDRNSRFYRFVQAAGHAGPAAGGRSRVRRHDRAHGRIDVVPEQFRDLRRERAGRFPLQGRQRDGADLQGPGRRASAGRRASICAGDIFGLETGDEHTFSAEAIAECKVLVIKRSAFVDAGGAGQRRRQPALDRHRQRAAAGSGSYHAADQERAGARRVFPAGNGSADLRRATPSSCRCRGRISPIISG